MSANRIPDHELPAGLRHFRDAVTEEKYYSLLEVSRDRIAELEAEVETARFSPSGDNHHNAALCPHCGEPLRKALEKIAKLEAEVERLKSLVAYAPDGGNAILSTTAGAISRSRMKESQMNARKLFDEAYASLVAKIGPLSGYKDLANIAIRLVEAQVTLASLEAKRTVEKEVRGPGKLPAAAAKAIAKGAPVSHVIGPAIGNVKDIELADFD